MAALAPLRLGVFGGTFDPVHNAHLAIARHARAALSLNRVLFVPAGRPRLRDRTAATAAHRLAMVRLAIAEAPDYDVSAIEIERPGPSYTVDTLAALTATAPAPECWFIIGADALARIGEWHEAARLPALTRLAVVARPGAALDLAALEATVPGITAVVDRVEMPPSPISATAIRARVAADAPIDAWVPPAVAAYIREQGLYRAR